METTVNNAMQTHQPITDPLDSAIPAAQFIIKAASQYQC